MSDYQTLLNYAETWLDRPDLTGQGPEFVTLAESRIARDVTAAHQRMSADWTLVSQETVLPDDWLSFISVPLQFMPPNRLFESVIYGETGEATSYTIDGRYLVVAPFSGTQALSVRYRARLPKLVNGTDTNLVLSQNPDLYLHAIRALIADRTQDVDLQMKFEGQYTAALERLNNQHAWGTHSGSALVKV